MSYIIIIIKLPENSGSLNDGVSETVTHEMKKQANYFFCMLLGTLGASMIGKMLIGKGVMRGGRRYDNMGHLDKIFNSNPSFK